MQNDEETIVTLRLPSTLSAYSGGKSQITLQAETIEELLERLAQQHPQIWQYLCNEKRQLREHVRIFVNNEVISGTQGLQTPLQPGQEVIVLPAISHSS